MDQLLQLPEQRLFHVTVENVAVEFLVERPGTETEQITSITRHDHAYIELFACTSGNVVIDTEDGKVVLGSGDIAVIPAHFRHIMVDSESSGVGGVVGITFIRRYVQNCTDLYSVFHGISEKNGIERIGNCPGLCDAVGALINVSAKSGSCLPALRLVLLLAEALEQRAMPERLGMEMSCIDRDIDRISRLDYLINSCFMRELTAKYVAESLFISERQLMRITQKLYGTTFRQALLNKRLDVAAKLLSETGDSVTEISRKVGFHSISHFYRSFGKRFGLPPSEYRTNRLKTEKTSHVF